MNVPPTILDASFAGKVAIVTGAASGIGHACACLLAERGAKVWSADLDPADQSTSQLHRLGVLSRRCDVRIEADVESLVGEVMAADGRVDILVNNAGVGCVGPIADISEEQWDRCLDTNLKGAFLFCKHAIGPMAKTGGAIVNISSNAGITPRADDPVYCISKAGLIMLTKALALSHARERIRVNAVCPGPVGGTQMIEREIAESPDPQACRQRLIAASPLASAFGRMADPREIAEAVAYLASDAAMMVTGTVLAIDGGKSIGVPPKTPNAG